MGRLCAATFCPGSTLPVEDTGSQPMLGFFIEMVVIPAL
jgi:hypothetical protein